jgi:general secretion pathway protein A
MYMDHFGLNKAPFAIEPDPHFMVLGDDHQEALSTLIYALEQQEGWALLLGRSGEGKTTLIMALMRELPDWVISAVITNPRLAPIDFYNILAMEMGMDGPYASKGEFLSAFKKYLAECRREGKTLLVVVDDAHALPLKMLEDLKLLGNQDDETPRVLNIFLVAQLEFMKLIKQAKPGGLLQRLRRFNHRLRTLTEEETTAYVFHRLATAGAPQGIFSLDSLRVLHEVSGGNCRRINSICDEAMLRAYSKGHKSVSSEIIRQAAASLPTDGPEEIQDDIPLATFEQESARPPKPSLDYAPAAKADLETGQREEAKPAVKKTTQAKAAPGPEPAGAAARSGPGEPKPRPARPAAGLTRPEPQGPLPEAEVVKAPAAAAPPKTEPVQIYELEELDGEKIPTETLLEDETDEIQPGFFGRTASRVFSRKGLTIIGVLLLVCMAGGATFLSLGGYTYMKRVYWSYLKQNRISVPEAKPAAQVPTDIAEIKVKRPPDWGPTFYAPTPKASVQGGSHG